MLTTEAILYYKDRPVEFVKDIIKVTPDDIQGEILTSVAQNQLTSVRSGHGIGKSALQSWLIYWFMCTRPFPKIPCTAPTKHQLHDILWAEVAKWRTPAIQSEIEWTQEKLYMKSNPENWFASGFFFDSHNKNRSIYSTFKVSGENSKRVSKEYIQMIIDMYGLDSDVYRVRVAGEFPKAMPDSFIQLDWVENCSNKKVTRNYPQSRIDVGVDVARYGDDETIINILFDKQYQQPFTVLHHNDTMQVTGIIVQLVERLRSQHIGIPIHIKIDCDGLGVGVYDRLKEIKKEKKWTTVKLYECHFGGAGGKNKQEEPVEFSNSTGLMWGLLREKLKRHEIELIYDDKQITQLSNRKYRINSDGKIELERKEEMKKRGLTSPDRGDALVLSLYEPKQGGLSILK